MYTFLCSTCVDFTVSTTGTCISQTPKHQHPNTTPSTCTVYNSTSQSQQSALEIEKRPTWDRNQHPLFLPKTYGIRMEPGSMGPYFRNEYPLYIRTRTMLACTPLISNVHIYRKLPLIGSIVKIF